VSETALPAARPRSIAMPLVVLVLVGLLEIALFLSGLALGAEGEDLLVLSLALITLLVGAGPILFNTLQPPEKRQILITLLTAVYVINLVMPVFTQYFLMKGDPLAGSKDLTRYHPDEIAHAQAVALLGLSMLLLGFYLPFGRLGASLFPKPTREWPPHAVLAVGLLTVALGWIVYIPGQLGLIPARAGSGALGTIASGSYFGISLLTLAWLRHRTREALLLVLIVIPAATFINFFTGSKRMFLTPLFMFALAYIVFERRIRLSWLAAGFGILIVLYPVSNFYRMVVDPVHGGRGGGRIATFLRNPGQTLEALSDFTGSVEAGSYVSAGLRSTGRRLDALGILTTIVKDTPERVPYQDGRTIGNVALAYIPRIIWPNKPADSTGEWVSQTYGNPEDLETDVGPTWMGEFYFNWGYAGVAFGMFAFGLLLRILQERLFFQDAPIPALFGAVVVLYCITRTVQSALSGPVNGTVFKLAPIPIAHYLVGMFVGFQRGSARPTPSRSSPDLFHAPADPAR
jgi:hypothetical protein